MDSKNASGTENSRHDGSPSFSSAKESRKENINVAVCNYYMYALLEFLWRGHKPRALHMQTNFSTVEVHPNPWLVLIKRTVY